MLLQQRAGAGTGAAGAVAPRCEEGAATAGDGDGQVGGAALVEGGVVEGGEGAARGGPGAGAPACRGCLGGERGRGGRGGVGRVMCQGWLLMHMGGGGAGGLGVQRGLGVQGALHAQEAGWHRLLVG